MELTELKRRYGDAAKKYRIPSFDELNKGFEIEKIEKESVYVLRQVRKVMMEKIVNSLGFLEMFLNPVNTPRMYAAYVRVMTAEDRKMIEHVYQALGELSIDSLDLELEYSEKHEAEVIARIFSVWNSIKPSFQEFLEKLKKPQDLSVKKERSYFG